MSNGRRSDKARTVPGQDVPAPDRRGGRGKGPDQVPDSGVPSGHQVGSRPRTGPKAFDHTGTWSWIEDAACRDADPRVFVPEEHHNLKDPEGISAYHVEVALINDLYCGACPVKVECLEHGRSHREVAAIWGGEGPLERGVLK